MNVRAPKQRSAGCHDRYPRPNGDDWLYWDPETIAGYPWADPTPGEPEDPDPPRVMGRGGTGDAVRRIAVAVAVGVVAGGLSAWVAG